MNLKKIISGLFIVGVVSILNISAQKDVKNLKIGDVMPNIKTNNLDIKELLPEKNRFKLIHFWASYDANSRIKNKDYSIFFASRISDKILYKSISLDEDKDICLTTLNLDSVENHVIFLGKENISKFIDLYNIDENRHSYLINDKGEICAINPTPEDIMEFYRI